MSFRWPRIQLGGVAAMLALGLLFTVFGAGALSRALGQDGPLIHLLFVTGAAALIAGLPIVQAVVGNAPSARARPGRFVLVHLLGCTLYCACAFAILRGLRPMVLSWYGLHPVPVQLAAHLITELPSLLLTYGTSAALWTALAASAARREATLTAATLEARLGQARLLTLRTRLDPTLVLPALSALKTTMRSDLPEAERAIQRLAGQLRRALAPQEETGPSELPVLELAAAPVLARRFAWPHLRMEVVLALLPLLVSLFLLQARSIDPAPYGGAPALYLFFAANALGLWLALPIAACAVLNSLGGTRLCFVLVHLLGLVLFGAVHTASARIVRGLVVGWSGIPITTTSWLFDVQLGLSDNMGLYLGSAALWTALYAFEARNQQALRATELHNALGSVQLELLMARLEPHFLYNALNTVSSLMYEDLELTERLLEGLEQLLSAVLAEHCAIWDLAQESELTRRFVELVEARFGDRISVFWQLPSALGKTQVPRFSLQVLVENAVKHNQQELGLLRICIQAERRASQVLLEVSDNGRGFAAAASAGSGLGLLQQVLRLHYGDAAQLSQQRGLEGGASVQLAVPALSL